MTPRTGPAALKPLAQASPRPPSASSSWAPLKIQAALPPALTRPLPTAPCLLFCFIPPLNTFYLGYPFNPSSRRDDAFLQNQSL